AVIFLAIYAATKFVVTERITIDTRAAKELGVLLTPIETTLEEGIANKIIFPVETRLYNECGTDGNFGVQKISTSSKSGIGNAWEKPGGKVSFYSKYIFSRNVEQGKTFNVVSMPFEFPFKVTDVILVWSGDYCFVSPPQDIEEFVTNLNVQSINVTNSLTECKVGSIKVCFDRTDKCDMFVNTQGKKVTKNNTNVYFEGNLVYGAIFADTKTYDCQVKRIMKRASSLASIYLEKTRDLTPLGCSSNMDSELAAYSSKAGKIAGTNELYAVATIAESLRGKNNGLVCKLF
ncbi:MAG: hypothetical protein WCK90_02650, partial [archaeon]